MKKILFIFALLLCMRITASPLGTAITYQGQLQDSGVAANGAYDLRFSLFDSLTNGNQVGPYVTNFAVAVSNSYFLATIDFGPGAFSSNALWLEIGVRSNNVPGHFYQLTPRQPLTPVPFALFGSVLSAITNITSITIITNLTNITGVINITNLAGVIPIANGGSAGDLTNGVTIQLITTGTPSPSNQIPILNPPGDYFEGVDPVPTVWVNSYNVVNPTEAGMKMMIDFVVTNDLPSQMRIRGVVLDAGWSQYDTNWNIIASTNFTGNSLATIIKYAHTRGLRFGVWHMLGNGDNLGIGTQCGTLAPITSLYRARTNNVATIAVSGSFYKAFPRHSWVTISGLGGSGYNSSTPVQIDYSDNTFTNIYFINSGANESQVSDTGGTITPYGSGNRIINDALSLASLGIDYIKWQGPQDTQNGTITNFESNIGLQRLFLRTLLDNTFSNNVHVYFGGEGAYQSTYPANGGWQSYIPSWATSWYIGFIPIGDATGNWAFLDPSGGARHFDNASYTFGYVRPGHYSAIADIPVQENMPVKERQNWLSLCAMAASPVIFEGIPYNNTNFASFGAGGATLGNLDSLTNQEVLSIIQDPYVNAGQLRAQYTVNTSNNTIWARYLTGNSQAILFINKDTNNWVPSFNITNVLPGFANSNVFTLYDPWTHSVVQSATNSCMVTVSSASARLLTVYPGVSAGPLDAANLNSAGVSSIAVNKLAAVNPTNTIDVTGSIYTGSSTASGSYLGPAYTGGLSNVLFVSTNAIALTNATLSVNSGQNYVTITGSGASTFVGSMVDLGDQITVGNNQWQVVGITNANNTLSIVFLSEASFTNSPFLWWPSSAKFQDWIPRTTAGAMGGPGFGVAGWTIGNDGGVAGGYWFWDGVYTASILNHRGFSGPPYLEISGPGKGLGGGNGGQIIIEAGSIFNDVMVKENDDVWFRGALSNWNSADFTIRQNVVAPSISVSRGVITNSTTTYQLFGMTNLTTPTVVTNVGWTSGTKVYFTNMAPSDMRGKVALTSAGGTISNWFTLTYGHALSNAPVVILTPEGGGPAMSNALSAVGAFYISTNTSTGFTVSSVAYGSLNGSNYIFNYFVVQ